MDQSHNPEAQDASPIARHGHSWSGRAPLWIEAGNARDWDAPRGPNERVLSFPRRRSLGVLYATYWNRRLPGPIDGGWWKIGSARGKVSIPAGYQVWLAVNSRAVGDISPSGA